MHDVCVTCLTSLCAVAQTSSQTSGQTSSQASGQTSSQTDALYSALFQAPSTISLSALSNTRVAAPYGTLRSLLMFSGVSDAFLSYHILNAARCCSVALSHSSLYPTLPHTLYTLFLNASLPQRASFLHHYLLFALVGDAALRRLLSSLFVLIHSTITFRYRSSWAVCNEDGLLAFLIDCEALLLAAQCGRSIEPSRIVSIASMIGTVLSYCPIETQNTLTHTLLMKWKNDDSVLGSCCGFMLAGFPWSCLKCVFVLALTHSDSMITKKLPAIFATLQEKACNPRLSDMDAWSVLRVCEGVVSRNSGDLKPFFTSVLKQLSCKHAAFADLALMKLSQVLVPAGIQPNQLRSYLEAVVKKVEGNEGQDAYCVVVAQIMETACSVMFPKRDLDAICACYRSMLRVLLRSRAPVQSYCLKSIVRFMM